MAAAQAAHSAGRLSESAELFKRLADSGDLEAKLYYGIVQAKQGKTEEALQTLNQVLELRANSFEALFWIPILLRKTGRLAEAAKIANQAADLQPQSPHAQNNLGVCEMETKNFEAAVAAFTRSSRLQPNDPVALYNLASCLGILGRDQDALQVLKRAAQIAPKSPEIRLLLAKTLLNLNDLDGALREGNSVLRNAPDSAETHRHLGLVLMHKGQSIRAKEHIDRALALELNNPAAHATLGSILQSLGLIEESAAAFRKSLDLEPVQGYAYFSLLHNQRLKPENRDILNRMEVLIAGEKLPPKDLSSLEYGLGKGYEDLGEYETAMQHYDAANKLARQLKFKDQHYNAKEAAASTDLKIHRYTASLFAKARATTLASDFPIFILGMMRSGTTLVEQIISSHSGVVAGGEQEFWLNRGLEALSPNGIPDIAKLKGLGRDYLRLLAEIGPNASHVTDKMPANYLALGLIHASFPNARIIHIRRNPVDTAISIYATPNRARIDYAHDKASIVAAYKEYERLMAYWRTVIPADRMMDVTYEELVEDRERVTRELAEFCGLTWEDEMLSPQSNQRSVVTPSVWQVRQPVYRSSMNRWKRFEPWLGPFAELEQK